MSINIAHTKPFLGESEAVALQAVFASKMVNQGAVANQLVSCVAQLVNGIGGVPTSTGTLGLHLALKTVGIETADDEVIIPDYACRCLYDCVKMAGGTPVFCDINLQDLSLGFDLMRSRLNKNTRAIILPHMYGCPANIAPFIGTGIPIIEDCAHSLGATYHGNPVGSFGALACFSMEGSKLIAAGEGGIVLANDRAMLDHLNDLRYGLNGHFAYHYRLSDMIAAVAVAQLDKLSYMIEKRRRIAAIYRNELGGLEEKGLITMPTGFTDRQSVYYRFIMICNEDSSDLIAFASQQGVLIRNPLPSGCLSDTYQDYASDNINSRLLAKNGVSLPIYPDLSDAEMTRTIHVIHDFYNKRSCHV